VDPSTFKLKREEIQRRIQTRRLALDSWGNHNSSEVLEKIVKAVGKSDVFGLAGALGETHIVRNMAGAAVSFLLTRWARKAFNHK
jgi:hypothetical protein